MKTRLIAIVALAACAAACTHDRAAGSGEKRILARTPNDTTSLRNRDQPPSPTDLAEAFLSHVRSRTFLSVELRVEQGDDVFRVRSFMAKDRVQMTAERNGAPLVALYVCGKRAQELVPTRQFGHEAKTNVLIEYDNPDSPTFFSLVTLTAGEACSIGHCTRSWLDPGYETGPATSIRNSRYRQDDDIDGVACWMYERSFQVDGEDGTPETIRHEIWFEKSTHRLLRHRLTQPEGQRTTSYLKVDPTDTDTGWVWGLSQACR